MAAIFADSFDHYATADLAGKWNSITAGDNSPTISAGNGRRSTQSLRASFSANDGRALSVVPDSPVPSGAVCVVGFAFRSNRFDTLSVTTNFDPASASNQGNYLLLLRQGATNHLAFRLNTNGTISVYRGQSAATLLGTSSGALTANVYEYLEIKVTIDNSVGAVEIRRDGIAILSLSGIDTQNTASATWDEIVICHLQVAIGTTTTWDYDDLYLLDGSTTADDPRTDFLGDSRVDATYPNANGNYNQSTPSGGAVDRYTMVDEALQDGDATYNTFAAAGDKDSYNYPTAPVAGASIHFLQANGWMRKEDAGAATARLFTRLSSTDYFGSARGPATSYSDKRQIWAQKPSDSADWTDTDYNAAEFGFEKET